MRMPARASHQGSRTFEDLHRVYAGTVYLDAVLVAPLLAFLPDTVAHHHHAVIAHAADDGFGDTSPCSNLAEARFCCNGIDDIAARPGRQVCRADDRDRGGHFFHFAVSGKAGDDYFIKLQMLVEYICRVRSILLSRRCHAYG